MAGSLRTCKPQRTPTFPPPQAPSPSESISRVSSLSSSEPPGKITITSRTCRGVDSRPNRRGRRLLLRRSSIALMTPRPSAMGRMHRASAVALLAMWAWLVASACDGGDEAETPIPTPIPGHPLAAKTGNNAVDRVLGAISTGDVDGLVDATEFVMLPCSTEDKLGGPPRCREGVPERTPVKSFPMGQGCEGSYLDEEATRRAFEAFVEPHNRNYAVYHDVPSPGDPSRFEFPRGEFVVVQSFPVEALPEQVGSRLIAITDGRIVTVGGWCLQSLEERVAGLAPGDFLLSPP